MQFFKKITKSVKIQIFSKFTKIYLFNEDSIRESLKKIEFDQDTSKSNKGVEKTPKSFNYIVLYCSRFTELTISKNCFGNGQKG